MNQVLAAAFNDEIEKIAGAKRLLRLSKSVKKGKAPYEAYERALHKYQRRVGGEIEGLIQSTPSGTAPIKHHGLRSAVPMAKSLPKRGRYYMKARANPFGSSWEDTARSAIKKK